jgi:hypothetical protein
MKFKRELALGVAKGLSIALLIIGVLLVVCEH